MEPTLYLQFQKAAFCYSNNDCLIEGETSLSYQQVLNLIDSIAEKLLQSGLSSGQTAALYSGKQGLAVIAFLACSKIGATCLTLDLAFPRPMVEDILSDADAHHIIHTQPLPFKTTKETIDLTNYDLNGSYQTAFSEPHRNAVRTAWIVCSSGTTGKPKGIELSDEAIISSIFARAKQIPYTPSDKVACNIYFYWEIFRPLFFGASAHIISDELLFDLASYGDYIHNNQITETLWTPSFAEIIFSNLSEGELSSFQSLKCVWLNGEVVQASLANNALEKMPSTHFYNLYSISETFDACVQLISQSSLSEEGFTSIGHPLEGVEIQILDNEGLPCPPNKMGELFIYSHSLAKGYLKNEVDTALSFVYPDKNTPSKRYFKTKDTGYIQEDGEVFVLGRNDHVVKLRGYNVSLLAIENVLKQILPISQCVVKIEGDDPAYQTLITVIVPNNKKRFVQQFSMTAESEYSQELLTYVSEHIPTYAMPSRYIIADSLDVEQYSSKLDRKKAFETRIEDPLKKLWQQVLKCPANQLTESSDFYELGGNSLQAVQLIHQLKKSFNLHLSIEALEKHRTLAKQRNLIQKKVTSLQREAINYHNDLSLEFEFKEPSPAKVNSLHEASNVFFTGATGFLGAHWLSFCLENTKAVYHCLVRAQDEKQAFQRLEESFTRYKLEPHLLKNRVQVVCGSLTEDCLGLEPRQWLGLCEQIDVILHAAAYVNLLYPYERLKPSIVDGGKRILQLALTHRLKPTLFVSSDAVYPNQPDIISDAFLGSETFQLLQGGYAQAKWVLEQLINKVANAHNLPFLIARPGNLSPAIHHGIPNLQDANRLVLQIIKQYKVIPENLILEFTPVDLFVEYITKKALHDFDGSILPISQFNKLNSADIQTLLADWNLEIIDSSSWQKLLEDNAPELLALWQLDGLFTPKKYSILHPASDTFVLSKKQQVETLSNLQEI